MKFNIQSTTNVIFNIESHEAFRALCKTLNMDFVLDEDGNYFIKRNDNDENEVWIRKGKEEEKFDDRGDLFIALRNVAVNIFPNCYFRNENYIYH